MPKYTKLLPPDEYEKLTLDQKTEYIVDMAELLRRRVESASPGTNPPPDEKPDSAEEHALRRRARSSNV